MSEALFLHDYYGAFEKVSLQQGETRETGNY